MLNEFINWLNGPTVTIVYYIYAILIIITQVLISLWNALDRTQKKRLKLIKQATADKTRTIGKICYRALKGTLEESYMEIEYIYTVDSKPYYITYELRQNEIQTDDAEEDYYNPDELVYNALGDILVYYDKKNPKKAVLKVEAFVSPEVFHQVRSKKINRHRDITSSWLEPMDLRKKVS